MAEKTQVSIPEGASQVLGFTHTITAEDIRNRGVTLQTQVSNEHVDEAATLLLKTVDPVIGLSARMVLSNHGTADDGAYQPKDTIRGVLYVTNESNIPLEDVQVVMDPESADLFALIPRRELEASGIVYNRGTGDNGAFQTGDTVRGIFYVTNLSNVALESVEVVIEPESVEAGELVPRHEVVAPDPVVYNAGTGPDGTFQPGDTVRGVIQIVNASNEPLKDVEVVFSPEAVEAGELVPHRELAASIVLYDPPEDGYSEGDVMRGTIHISNRSNVTVNDIQLQVNPETVEVVHG